MDASIVPRAGAVVPIVRTPPSVQTWEILRQEEESQQIALDQRKASALHAMATQGFDEIALASACQLSSRLLQRFLRYHRFCTQTQSLIPEKTFSDYWLQVCDPYLRKNPHQRTAAYETQVFQAIAALVTEGTPPLPRRKRRKPSDPASVKIVCEHLLKKLHEDFLPLFRDLKPMLHVPKAMIAPTMLARIGGEMEGVIKDLMAYLMQATRATQNINDPE